MNSSRRVFVAGSIAALALSGCMVVPLAADGTPIYPTVASYPYPAATTVPYRAPVYAPVAPVDDGVQRTGAERAAGAVVSIE